MMQLMDINLLPRQERIGNAYKVTAVTLVICAILGAVLIAVNEYMIRQSLSTTRQELETTKKLHAVVEQKLTQGNSGSSVAKGLQAMIPLVEQIPVSAVSILNELVALLPERGFLLSYQYSEANVNMTVQFDTIYETAAFLHTLNQTEWVDSVVMPGVAAGGSDASASAVGTVPRHTAAFQIKLNLNAFRVMEGKGK
jgi:type IV pilus assembly protein PilN